jgi:signal transduction histidine kinase
LSGVFHELHLFQHELLDAFVVGFCEAGQALLGYDFQIIESEVLYDKEWVSRGDVIVQLDYTGSSVGFLSVMGEHSTFCSLLGGMDVAEGEGNGVVKEMLNTASGGLLELLKNVCPVVTLLSPKLIFGRVDYPRMSYLSKRVMTMGGELCFVVAIDQRTLDIDTLLKDTTEVKNHLEKAKKDLVEAEKMAALGELVAGVAHEVNTPLGVGVTGVSHLLDMFAQVTRKYRDGQLKKSDFQSFLESSGDEVELVYSNLLRASKLVQSFKKVAVDHGVENMRPFSIVSYLRETISSLSYMYASRNIEVVVEGDESLVVFSYPTIVAQLVTHLISNAVSHGFEDSSAGYINICIYESGDDFVLECRDNGVGMDLEVKNRVFDPFFTTKRGRGSTGLGMHIIYNAVTQTLGGTVRCDSERGMGTTFKVICPLGR